MHVPLRAVSIPSRAQTAKTGGRSLGEQTSLLIYRLISELQTTSAEKMRSLGVTGVWVSWFTACALLGR